MNRYWNNNGEEQAKYNEMLDADFNFTQRSLSVFNAYYRHYNDGDTPAFAKKNSAWTKWSCAYERPRMVLNEAGREELERRVTEAVRYEYARFTKATKAA